MLLAAASRGFIPAFEASPRAPGSLRMRTSINSIAREALSSNAAGSEITM
jgi:hypothetical protein